MLLTLERLPIIHIIHHLLKQLLIFTNTTLVISTAAIFKTKHRASSELNCTVKHFIETPSVDRGGSVKLKCCKKTYMTSTTRIQDHLKPFHSFCKLILVRLQKWRNKAYLKCQFIQVQSRSKYLYGHFMTSFPFFVRNWISPVQMQV